MNGNSIDIQLLVNDQPARLDTVQLRGLNFGRSCPDFPIVAYSLVLPLTYLANQMADFYHEFVQDDLEHGTDDDRELVLHIRELGWPELSRLVQIDPALFLSFVKHYLAFDFLSLIHKRFAQESNPRYIINSVDDVNIVGTKICFSGVALDVGAKPH